MTLYGMSADSHCHLPGVADLYSRILSKLGVCCTQSLPDHETLELIKICVEPVAYVALCESSYGSVADPLCQPPKGSLKK